MNLIGEIMKNYDIIVVGAGAAGAFLAFELTKLDTKLAPYLTANTILQPILVETFTVM